MNKKLILVFIAGWALSVFISARDVVGMFKAKVA